MKPTPSVKFALYVRASTEEQQNTLIAQAEGGRKYCEWKEQESATLQSRPARDASQYIFGPFIDSGVSGSTPFFDRAAVGLMLDAMQREGITDIVMSKLDRGFRNALDCLLTFAELKARGMHIHILNMNLDTRSPMGKFFLTMAAGIAELENANRSERQKDAFAVMRRTAQKCGNQVPYGWQVAADGKSLIPHPAEQAVLARLVTGDLSALSPSEAKTRLNAERIPTKMAGKVLMRHGQPYTAKGKWTAAAVLSVRKNPRLAAAVAQAA